MTPTRLDSLEGSLRPLGYFGESVIDLGLSPAPLRLLPIRGSFIGIANWAAECSLRRTMILPNIRQSFCRFLTEFQSNCWICTKWTKSARRIRLVENGWPNEITTNYDEFYTEVLTEFQSNLVVEFAENTHRIQRKYLRGRIFRQCLSSAVTKRGKVDGDFRAKKVF